MLLQRVLTALVLLVVLLATLFVFPAWTWGVLTLIFLAVAAREWLALLGGSPWAQNAVAVGVFLVGMGLLAWWLTIGWPAWFAISVAVAATAWWCLAAPARLVRHDARGGGWPLAAALLLACWIALLELRALGAIALLAGMSIVWIADIAAYFVGRSIGRRKLAPSISPGKSWEGAIGGALAVVIAALIVALGTPGHGGTEALAQTLPARLHAAMPDLLWVPVFAVLAALSVVGDLHESLLKRQAGAKDSGTILPGHGGVLDRIDALIPVMPAVLLLHRLAG